jgi:hypothetical protein
MATSDFKITEGAGINIATNSFSEDAITKELQRVVLNDSAGTELTVDTSDVEITAALPAGTNAIGKLAANSGVDIGDVDVTSISAGTNLIGKVGIDQVSANANEVVVKSGTVTAVTAITNALPAGTNAIGKLAANSGVDIGDVDVTSIAAGDNNIGNVDIVTMPTVELKAGTAAIGKLAANSGVDIGDVDVTSLPATPAGTNLIGKVGIDQVSANANEVVVKSGTVDLGATDNAVLDSIQTAVETIDDAIAGSEMQVDVVGALPAGTNAIGKLAANSGVDIGDVDVTSISAGDNNIGNVDIVTVPAPLSVVGTGTEATAMRVTIASDSTGVLSVDDNGGALTVDGTVTANLSATDNAVLDSIQTAVETIDNAIAGSEMQVDVVASLPAGTNAIGKLAANSGVDIGDVDVTSMPTGASAAAIQGTVAAGSEAAQNPVQLGAKAVSAIPAVVDANDVANLLTDLFGRLVVAAETPGDAITEGNTATITNDSATEVLAAAGANTKWRITAIGVYNSDATVGTWVKIQDDTAGTPVVYWRGYCAPAGGGFNLNFSPPLPAKGQANGKVNVVAETTSAEIGCSVSAFKVPG